MIVKINNERVFFNDNNPLGQREAVPKQSGLYLIGNTIFNPLTNEQFFMVKVGMSSNLYDRMKGYATANPMMFHIDYKVINCEGIDLSQYPSYKRANAIGRYIKAIEEKYHQKMEALDFIHFEYAKEWFLVSKETYMEICEKKFNFFKIEV